MTLSLLASPHTAKVLHILVVLNVLLCPFLADEGASESKGVDALEDLVGVGRMVDAADG